jgi:adenylate cyclase
LSAPSSERRLAAIMFTDIVGYSALTQRDEALALRILERHNELIRPILSRHNGIEVKTMGDAFLVEFNSALEATECATDLQRVLREYNEKSDEKLKVRIGIHVGDVIHRGGDVFGDSVNIASRIEALAQGGGVCISEQVYSQVRNKIPLKMTKLEPQELKNIKFTIDVFKVEMPWESEAEMKPESNLDMQRLAVLPFANISPDPNDAYFADGLTEELISKLSLIKDLKVIARTSTMKYKGNERKSISEIGEELGAGILIEGSVRKAGNRIRVAVQVINANNQEHLWSSNYDGNLDDIFAVQEEIATKVSDSSPAYVFHSRPPIHVPQDTKNVTAYTYYLRGIQLLNEGKDDSLREALELFNQATKLDPSFARAYVGIGNCYAQLGIRSYISFEESVAGEKSSAAKALEIDPNLAEAHSLLSFNAWGEDDFEKAEKEARKAVELNPNLAEAQFSLARLEMTLGYPKSSLKLMEVAHTLDPLSGEIIRFLGLMLAWMGRDSEAIDLWDRSVKIAPFETHLALAEYALSKQDLRNFEEEIRILENLAPSDFRTISFRAYLQALQKDAQGLEKTTEKLTKLFKGGATFDRHIGYLHYMEGDMDAFFEAMFRAVETHVLDPFRMRYSSLFEKARRDPRYRRVFEKTGLDPDLKEPMS